MRWLAVWLFLTAAWWIGWWITQAVFGGGEPWRFTAEAAAHLVAVPLAQVAALRGLLAFRRMFRDQRQSQRPDPPPDQ